MFLLLLQCLNYDNIAKLKLFSLWLAVPKLSLWRLFIMSSVLGERLFFFNIDSYFNELTTFRHTVMLPPLSY